MTTVRSSFAWQRAAAVGLLLLAVYWLTVSGAFHSVDEHAVFAAAHTLALHGRVDQSALYWNAGDPDPASIGIDGELYSKYGIGHSLAAALGILLGRAIPGAGLASTTMLIDGLATALTGGLLVLAAARLGYKPAAGAILGLCYGLATFAWLYARTMFGEPLVALGWLAAVWVLLIRQDARRALIAGLLVALSVTVRPALIVVTPCFALLFLDRPLRASVTRLLAYGLPIAVTGAALLAFNYARFGDWWQFGYSETFNGSLAAGLSGFLVSPDRSIFLAAPLLLALPWSWPAFWRRNRRVAVTVLVTALVMLVVNGAWPVFWGGPVWGPRYLLPMLPLLFLSLAPFAQAALDRPGWQRVALPLLALAGVALTLPDVIWNRLPIVQTLGQRYPLWRVAPRPEWLDLAWLSTHPQGFLLAGGLLIAGIIALVRPGKACLGVTSLACIAGSVILLSWLGSSTLGYASSRAYGEALTMLASRAGPGDALVLNPARYQDGLGEAISFLNAQQLRIPVYAVYREDAAEPEAGTSGATDSQRMDQIFRRHDRVWLLTQGAGEGDANSTTERYLARTAAIEGTQWLADGYRLTSFARPFPAIASGDPHTELGDVVSLDRWEIGSQAGTEGEPGSVQVRLHWRPLAAVQAPLHTFVQAWDAEGKVLAQWSGVPGAGFAPTQGWEPGQPVDERVSLVLPQDQAVAPIDIVVGMYDSSTGKRLLTADGRDVLILARVDGP